MLELPTGVAVLLVALTISATSDPRTMRTALYRWVWWCGC